MMIPPEPGRPGQQITIGYAQEHEEEAFALVRRRLPYVSAKGQGGDPTDGLVALASGHVVGAVIVLLTRFDEQQAAWIKYLVVDAQCEGGGIATQLLTRIANMVGPGTLLFGGCADTEAGFYQKAGFHVLPAGQPLDVIQIPKPLVNSSASAPRWFHRTV